MGRSAEGVNGVRRVTRMLGATLSRPGESIKNPDLLAAVAAVLLGVLLLPLQLVSSQVYIVVIPPLVGLAGLVYLLARRSGHREEYPLGYLGREASQAVTGFVLVATALLAAVAVATGGRTLPFLAFATVVGAIILGQIVFVTDGRLTPGLILGEILLFALVLRFGALATTPGLVGVDSWTHIYQYAAGIQDAHALSGLPPTKYLGAPLYHVLTVVVAESLGLSLRTALYLSVGLLLPIGAIFIYGAARYFVPVRWALFATALFALSDQAIVWGIHLIPTSLGLFFFLAILYALTRLHFTAAHAGSYALLLVFSVAIILTHQVSAFITLVFLGTVLVAHAFVRFGSDTIDDTWVGSSVSAPKLLAIFVVDLVIAVANWSLTPYGEGASFLSRLVEVFQRSLATSFGFLNLAGESGSVGPQATVVPDSLVFLNSLGFFVLLFAMVLGGLAFLNRRVLSRATLAYVVVTGVLLVFAFGLPMFGIRTFLPGRWYPFLYAPMAILAAGGLVFVVRRLPRGVVVPAVLVFALVFPGAMLVSDTGTPDNPVFEDKFVRYSYNEAELAAVETIGTMADGTGSLWTDHPYRTVFTRTDAQNANTMRVENGEVTDGTVVYRRYQSTGASAVLFNGTSATVQLPEEAVCPDGDNRVYANAEVQLCTATGDAV